MKPLTKIALILILSLLTAPVFLLKGCGSPEASHGSVITINPSSSGSIACGSGTLVMPYRVTVLDKTSAPLQGVQVTISSGWAFPFVPTLYRFYADPAGVTGPQSSPFTGVTDNYGVYSFSAVVPCRVPGQQLPDPVNAAFTASTIGGLTPSGTYYYRVSAINAVGETLASAETSITLTAAQNAVNVNWGAVTGATGYRIYGNTTGGELLMAAVGAVTTWLDDGSITPAGALPGANTTALATPVNAAFTAGAGTLNDGTYYYRVSAINAVGETFASAETSLAVAAGAGLNGVNVNWGAVTGATGYNIYGRTTGAELFIATVAAVTTFLDDGSVAIPAGALPGANTTALATPVNAAFTATTVGLTPSSQYCYSVTARDVGGNETAASTETCITLAGTENAVTVNWTAVAGAIGYRIYGRTLGAGKLLMATVGAVTTWLDNGSITPAGASPPAINSTVTGMVTNTFTDTIYVTSGTANATSAITFN